MKFLERKHSWFELAIISLIVFAATSGALSFQLASLISLAHGLFLITIFLFVRLLLGRIHTSLGRAFFAFMVIILCAELLVQALTGLHLNRFMLSILWQPNVSTNTGAPVFLLYIVAAIIAVLAYLLSSRFSKNTYTAKARTLGVLLAIAGLTAQGLHALLFFTGQQEVMSVRRSLPLFTAPHPYHIRMLLTPVLGDQGENPFALPQHARTEPEISAPIIEITNKKNVLLIVSDSLRSRDIQADPTLAPNIHNWAQKGWINYDHYSVSNCTHFSMFTLLTSKLPNHYSTSRERGYAKSLFDVFNANGYATGTSEASPLDWYDLSSIVIPKDTKRTVAPAGNAILNDEKTTANALEAMLAAKQENTPFFHLAYYYGSHFPYSHFEEDDQSVSSMPALDGYHATIRAFDHQLGLMMKSLEAEGLLEDTIIVLTSDHGEEFLDDGFVGHASRLSDDQVKVPFLVIGGNGGPASIKSHDGFTSYLYSNLSTEPSQPLHVKSVILANCNYEYPDGFSLLYEDARYDFDYRDGYLTPLSEMTAEDQSFALGKLLQALKKH